MNRNGKMDQLTICSARGTRRKSSRYSGGRMENQSSFWPYMDGHSKEALVSSSL
jgi:hypothetical protein